MSDKTQYGLYERSYTTGRFGKHLNFHKGIFIEEIANQKLKPLRILKTNKNQKLLQAFYSIESENSPFLRGGAIQTELKTFYSAMRDFYKDEFYTIKADRIKRGFTKILNIFKGTQQEKSKAFKTLNEILKGI